MLDQNTDRMWYVIGAVIIGAAIILIMNKTFHQLFASVGDTFKDKTEQTTEMVDGILPKGKVNDNLLISLNVGSGWLNDVGLVAGVNADGSLSWQDWTSDYIAVEDADYITFTTNGRHHIKRAMFYSDKETPIGDRSLNSEPEDTVMVYDVPEGATYIRVSSMNWGEGYFKVERGKYSTGEPPKPDDIYFGQNLLKDTSSFTTDGTVTSNTTRTVTDEGYLKVVADALVTDQFISDVGLSKSSAAINSVLEKGDMYTFSIQIKLPDISQLYGGTYISLSVKTIPAYNPLHGRIGPNWEMYYMTASWDGTAFVPEFRLHGVKGTLLFRQAKLEKGIGATAYSAAPRD